MISPYDKALQAINEVIEKDAVGKELRARGDVSFNTWNEKDTKDASHWLEGYVRALEDNVLITGDQLQLLHKQIGSLKK